jgi:hypothetical protein
VQTGTETQYDHITYNSEVGAVEVTTSQPETAQEFLAYKFTLTVIQQIQLLVLPLRDTKPRLQLLLRVSV